MKRYLLFQGENYYPSGGWYDFAGSFDSVEEAQASMDPIEHTIEGTDGYWRDPTKIISTTDLKVWVAEGAAYTEEHGVEHPQDIPDHFIYVPPRKEWTVRNGWAHVVDLETGKIVASADEE